MTWLASTALVLAAVPAWLLWRNLRLYRPAPAFQEHPAKPLASVSVLIPARNEERNIAEALTSVLANEGIRFEVVVLDDGSQDRTAALVGEFAQRDSRVRLAAAPPLPTGWCGKPHACHVLAGLAKHPVLVFMDADVRLDRHALQRMVAFLEGSGADLASGVPRQITRTGMEKLLVPLIHFVLLGFLPMGRMRASRDPSCGAGCGQLFIARADAYARAGGHAAIRQSLHDGIKLPRQFRAAGLVTDLFDATDIARCRMFERAIDAWNGLGRNATEGLAAPKMIVPATVMLFGGQVLPWVLMPLAGINPLAGALAGAAALLSLAPRVSAARRFRQSAWTVLGHPLGILLLLIIQWQALSRLLSKRPSSWRGRSYPTTLVSTESASSPAVKPDRHLPKAGLLLALGLGGMLVRATPSEVDPVLSADPTNAPPPQAAAEPGAVASFELSDQHEHKRAVRFPREKLTVITVADHKGSEQLEAWISPIRARYGKRIEIEGVADVSSVPAPMRGMIRRAFRKQLDYPVMLDWQGQTAASFRYHKQQANLYLVDRTGKILARHQGQASPRSLGDLFKLIDRQLQENN